MSVPFHVSVELAANPNGKLLVELQEWQPKDFSLTQCQVLDLLKLAGEVLEVHGLPTGETRLKPGPVVGRLCTRNVDLLIRPKCPIPSLLLMLAEVYELAKVVADLAGYETSVEITDLLVQVFLRQVDWIVQRGLKQGYVPQQEELLGVRGRINVRPTLTKHLRGRVRVDCSFDEYMLDIPENQILLTALRVIAANPIFASPRRNLAHRLGHEFCGVREIDIAGDVFRSFKSDRLSSHYDPALKMARLILRSMGVEHDFGCAEVSGFTLNMNQLFEDFVARRFQKLLSSAGVVVSVQRRFAFDEANQAAMRPDLVFQSPRGPRVVADTKYKLDGSQTPGDLYQMLAYCRILKIPRGILIVPGNAGATYRVNDGVTTIEVVPIDLSRPISEINCLLSELGDRIVRTLADGT